MIENDAIQIVLSSLSSPVRQERLDSLYWLMYRSHPLIAPAVIPLLRDKDPEIRRLAIEVLGENRDRDSVRALRDVLNDRDARVREAAATALGKLGDRDVVPPLLKLLDDPETRVRAAVATALGKLGDPRAIKALVRAMENSAETAAIASAQALLALGTPEALTAIARFRVGDDYEFAFERKMAEPEETTRGGIPPEMMPGIDISPATPAPSSASTDIQFSAFYPKEVAPSVWMPMRAYIYRAGAADAVNADARKELGALMAIIRRVTEAARSVISEGAMITATPTLPGFQFNPPSVTLGFYEDWHRFDFKLRAKDTPNKRAANGMLTFTIEGVIVADIPLSIYVDDGLSSAGSGGSAESHTSATSKPYSAIFCSYSHRDTQIVERVERAYKALGMDFLRDVTTLKSGQKWNAELLRMIERADIFQLFWSSAAAKSKYVRQEWEHALSQQREGQAFIRPVYWEQPMPPVPPELGSIHFAYEPDLDD
jgi:hypothetical protein